MKFRSSILYACFAFLVLHACSGVQQGATISGTLDNASDIMVYLQQIDENGETTLDSTMTDSNGNFTLSNPVKNLDYYVFRTGDKQLVFLVLQGGEKIKLSGDANNMDATYTVSGSKDSELIAELRRFEKKIGDSLNQAYLDFRELQPEKVDSFGAQLQAHYTNSMQEFAETFIRTNMNSIVSLSVTKFLNQQTSLSLMDELGTTLQSLHPENKYVKDYMNLVAELKKLPVGSAAPEITQASPSGQMISLSSLRGKVVLIDFWASWCGPCRQENPRIVALHQKYKSAGFTVFGVSLDDNADAWKQAIVADGLNWTQVSDLKKWKNEAAKAYGVSAIPFSVLIDRNGNIIAKGIHGPELEEKIKEALAKTS